MDLYIDVILTTSLLLYDILNLFSRIRHAVPKQTWLSIGHPFLPITDILGS